MTIEPPRLVIELRPSLVCGVGVFAVRGLNKGSKVADGLAESDFADLVPWARFESFDRDVQEKVMDFCIGTPDGFVPPDGLDFNKLTVEWYLNHSCEGNCGFDDWGDFVAIRSIKKGEELTYDYGLAESNPEFEMRCVCRSENCRKLVTGNDWLDEGFQRKNIEYMHPHLRRLVREVCLQQ